MAGGLDFEDLVLEVPSVAVFLAIGMTVNGH